MIARGVPFDVIGLSYYPKWHNTLADLAYNLDDLSRRYEKDLIVVEYSYLKREVNELSFNVINNRGKGTCIWEPLNTWDRLFNKEGKADELLLIYEEMNKKYLKN
jgi:arabinogalactan endo-1,4-beta-galactosidase